MVGLSLICRPFSSVDGLGGYYFGSALAMHVIGPHRRSGTLTFNAVKIRADHACDLVPHGPSENDGATDSKSDVTIFQQELYKCLEAFHPFRDISFNQ